MTKWYLFCGSNYYQDGGVFGYRQIIETASDQSGLAIDKAKELLLGVGFDWAHLANDDMQIVWQFEKQ